MKKSKLIAILYILTFTFASTSLFAQGPPPPPGGNPSNPNSTSGPIDSGALFLLAAVSVYGYMRLKENSNNVQMP